MGVSARHTRRTGGLQQGREQPHSLTARGRRPANATPDPLATDVVVPGAGPRSRDQPHTPERAAEGARGHPRKHVEQDTDRRRCEQPLAGAGRRSMTGTDGPRGNADTDRTADRWLGEDGPPVSRCCWRSTTLLAVSSTPCSASTRTPRSYLLLMRGLIRSYGHTRSHSIQTAHGVFKHTPPSETASAPTQFSRAMGEIGVQLIFARSSSGQRPRGTRRGPHFQGQAGRGAEDSAGATHHR